MYRKLIPLFIFLGLSVSNKASHIRGAEINWNCIGGGDYIFTLSVFMECNQGFPPGVVFLQGPFGNITCRITNPGGGVFSVIDPCSANCIEDRRVWVSDTVSLSGVPPAGGWEFSWNVAGRAPSQNISSGLNSLYIVSKMYPYTPPGSPQPLNTDSCYNHSPRFLNQDPVVVCSGPYSFHHQISDLEQDSVQVEFTSPSSSATIQGSYVNGFSANMPFPDSTENPLNQPNLLDAQTALVQTEFYSPTAGNYQYALKAKEYRQGQLISEVIVDRSLVVLSAAVCTNASANNRPNLSMTSNNTLSLTQVSGHYELNVRQGDTIDLNLTSTDFDVNSMGVPQQICLSAQSNFLNQTNPTLAVGCLAGNCATLNPISSNGFCGSMAETYRFQWVPDCSSLNLSSGGQVSHLFHFEVQDNACPVKKSRHLSLVVNLQASVQAPLGLSLLQADTMGTARLQWTRLNLAAGLPFTAYRIYSRDPAGTFALIDSIDDIDSTEAVYSNLNFPQEFYVDAISGSCPSAGRGSNIINTNVALALADIYRIPDFVLSPNPAQDRIHIELRQRNDAWKDLEARLYSLNGQLLRVYPLGDGQNSWSLGLAESPGLYIIELHTAQWSQKSKLLIE